MKLSFFPALLAGLSLGACQQQMESSTPASAQSVPVRPAVVCSCPAEVPQASTTPDTLFVFSAGPAVSVCGSREKGQAQEFFSEFAVSTCQPRKVLKYWDVREKCRLSFRNDTLTVESVKNLPAGKNFSYEFVTFRIDQFFPRQGQIRHHSFLNKQLAPYSAEEVARVKQEFEKTATLKPEKSIELANRLLLSALSGDQQAGVYFRQFPDKYPLSGGYAEEYAELQRLLRDWDREAAARR
ncbi:hypothetical protein [Hymenobacter cellulosivorans]|uniref:DUF4476 domain-containing protein n=1 Tax=Hymenobacter cellulosivorans TaxID=2932249 RepID=A0ABY4F4D1_9BACT|nr:hypothetical protein [Hymenobacter cellulosivorans]UOQ51373.1 hypothetical protein MUN80_16585 [Hymenobacter cellulosivorans]